jgi:cold shock protein
VFLHIGVLKAAGYNNVAPDAKLQVQIGEGQKGRLISAIIELTELGSSTGHMRRTTPTGPLSNRQRPDPTKAIPLEGAVKWFNSGKGFGFAIADDGGQDVFLHRSVLERSRFPSIVEGQKVTMQVVTTPKGREAISIELIE